MASVQQSVESFEFAPPRAMPATHLTEDEFVAWCDEDTRAEWVDGEVIVMSPASTIHNRLTRFLLSLLEDFVAERELGEAFGSDLSIRIHSRRRLPDVLFVGRDRRDRLREKHFEGAPNLVIEVVSDDSVDRDWRIKYLEYEAAGVEEYWVVDPLYKRVEVYALGDDRTYHSIPLVDGKLASRVVPGFYMRLEWLWKDPLPKVPGILQELLAAT
jgi:Uma2 family endonuclease